MSREIGLVRWNLGHIVVTEDAFNLLVRLVQPIAWFLSVHSRKARANMGSSALSEFQVSPGQGVFVFTLVRAGRPNSTLVYTNTDDVWTWTSQAQPLPLQVAGPDLNLQ